MARSKVKDFVDRANSKLTVRWAAILLASSTLISSLLGLYRDRLLNSLYLDSYPVGIDAYTVAFTIPDFMFFILVSGALSVTFIPVFNQRLKTGNKKSAWELSSSMINFMALITLLTSLLIIVFAEPLVKYVVSPGLNESGTSLAISMMRVIAVNPFLFAVATVIASMQQAVGRFTFYALAPTIYNIGIIIGAVFFTNGINIFGWQVFEGGIMGVALGVVLGAVLQLLVSSIGLIGLGFDYQMKINWKHKGFRRVLRLLPARSVDQGMDYINSIVETNIASRFVDGTVRAYQQASSLSLMPVNLVGVAISTAIFPRLTDHVNDGRMDLFKKDLRATLRLIIWMALPIATITFFTRGYIVSFIKNGGNTLIAGILGAMALLILFRIIYHIVARAFYAQQDTRTPMYISIFAISLNVVLAILLAIKFDMEAYGLAWAQSIVAAIEVFVLLFVLTRKVPGILNKRFASAVWKMIVAVSIMGIVTYLSVLALQLQSSDQSFLATFPKFMIICIISGITYLVVSRVLKIKEADPTIKYIEKILFGKIGPTS